MKHNTRNPYADSQERRDALAWLESRNITQVRSLYGARAPAAEPVVTVKYTATVEKPRPLLRLVI